MTFFGCDEVIEDLIKILRGWDIREEPPEPSGHAIVRLKRTRYSYRRVSPWTKTLSECRKARRIDNSDALFGIHYDLLKWYVEAQRTRPCLHNAAVKFASGLIAFLNETKTGKTTLTIQLAMLGHPIFCDGWLPIEQPDSLGVALGILPWSRLPALTRVRADFKRYLKSRRGPGNRRWMYVDLRAEELTSHGATAHVRTLVLLDRKAEIRGRARVEPVPKDKMLTELIEQNYARQLSAMDIFDKLHTLTETADCFSLRYASVNAGAAVLQDAFGRPT